MHHLRVELTGRDGRWLESVQACSAAYTLPLRRPRLDAGCTGPRSLARALPAASNTSLPPARPYIHTSSSLLFLEKFIFLETFLYSYGIYWRSGWMIWRADTGDSVSLFFLWQVEHKIFITHGFHKYWNTGRLFFPLWNRESVSCSVMSDSMRPHGR